MQKRNKLLFLGIIFLFLFSLFSLFIHFGKFVTADLGITETLQSKLPRIIDTSFSMFSLFGSLETVSIILFIWWAIYRKLNFIFVLGAFGVMHLIELFAKAYVTHFPPPFRFFRYDLDLKFPSSYVQPGYSYPSGHAARTAFLSTLLIVFILNSKLSKNRKYILVGLILVFDLVMYISRIYLGEHWASDVIGGIFIGTSFSLLSCVFLFSKSTKAKLN